MSGVVRTVRGRNVDQIFGTLPYEDFLTSQHPSSAAFSRHTDVEALDIPLPSKEGFIRQVLGWREFVHHVHTITDGFRRGLEPLPEVLTKPRDGGSRTWAGKAWPVKSAGDDPHGGACPNRLGAQTHLPPAFWVEPSGLHCLDSVVSIVWAGGYSHHPVMSWKKRSVERKKFLRSITRIREAAMKQDETEERLGEECSAEGRADDTAEDAFKKASQIEQIDDSQLPQSITKLFKNQ